MVPQHFTIGASVLLALAPFIYALAVYSQRHRLKSASPRRAEFYPPGESGDPPSSSSVD